MTEAERVVLDACRQAAKLPVAFDGEINAVLVWTLIGRPRPRGTGNAGSVLKRMRSLARQGRLVETRGRTFRLPADA